MSTETPPDSKARNGRRMRAAGMLAAGAIAGGVLAGTLTASADSSTGTSNPPSGSYAMTAPGAGGGAPMNVGGDPVRSDETTPSDDVVATLTRKAEAEVSGGTVYRVETDAGDAAYEAHMKKADGTLVTVKFDKDLDVTAVEDGMGQGDPAPGTTTG